MNSQRRNKVITWPDEQKIGQTTKNSSIANYELMIMVTISIGGSGFFLINNSFQDIIDI